MATSAFSDDVPALVLFERVARLSGFDVPTLIVWNDGTVVVSEGIYGESLHLVQSRSTAENTRALVASVIAQLRDAPAYVAIHNATHQPSVQLMFRDGDTSRVVEAYGLRRDGNSGLDPAHDVRAVYHQLLDARPSGGAPAPTTYRRPPGWPESLPSYRGQDEIDQLVRCARGGR